MQIPSACDSYHPTRFNRILPGPRPLPAIVVKEGLEERMLRLRPGCKDGLHRVGGEDEEYPNAVLQECSPSPARQLLWLT